MKVTSLILAVVLLCLSSSAATFTTSALITEADTSFDGQDMVVSDATLTVDGRHSLNLLLFTPFPKHVNCIELTTRMIPHPEL